MGVKMLPWLFLGWHKYEQPMEAHFRQSDGKEKILQVIIMRNFLEIMT